MKTETRFALFYAAAIGALSFVPFLSPWIAKTHGAVFVGPVLAILPLGRLLGGTGWAWVADRSGRPELVVRGAAIATAVFAAALWFAPSVTTFVLALGGFALMRAPQFPIVDAAALDTLGSRYGHVRMWGSLVFLALVLLAGETRALSDAAPLAAAWVLLLVAAALSFTLPFPERPPKSPGWSNLVALGAYRPMWWLMAIAVGQGMTLTAYDSMFTLHAEEVGLGDRMVSIALAVGVLGEVLVMANAPMLLSRVRPETLILLAALSGIPRWLVTATASSGAAMITAQALHALGFGAFWIGGTRWVSTHAPAELRSTAQSLFPAAGWGLGYLTSMGIASLVVPALGTRALFLTSSAEAIAVSAMALWLWRMPNSPT